MYSINPFNEASIQSTEVCKGHILFANMSEASYLVFRCYVSNILFENNHPSDRSSYVPLYITI